MQQSVVVAGALAQRPYRGGHAWVFLQYLLGFRSLGWDVLFIDVLTHETSTDQHGGPTPAEHSVQARYLARVMSRYGLDTAFCLLTPEGSTGMGRTQALEQVRRSDLLINVMGYLDDPEFLEAARLRVFLDIDPGFGHMWRELGLDDMFQGHDRYATIGTNVGKGTCDIPSGGIPWITLHQPVALDHWPVVATTYAPFTSVVSWRGPFDPILYRDRTYGLRVHEFRRFAPFPTKIDVGVEIALDIDEADEPDARLLKENHWQLVDPLVVAAYPWTYQRYLQQSGAELMIAKEIYVATQSGWVSDRSICYLASGKPVLAQHTAVAEFEGLDQGVICFTNLDEAIAGAQELVGNYAQHARAARSLAEDVFDARKVLVGLLDKVGANT